MNKNLIKIKFNKKKTVVRNRSSVARLFYIVLKKKNSKFNYSVLAKKWVALSTKNRLFFLRSLKKSFNFQAVRLLLKLYKKYLTRSFFASLEKNFANKLKLFNVKFKRILFKIAVLAAGRKLIYKFVFYNKHFLLNSLLSNWMFDSNIFLVKNLKRAFVNNVYPFYRFKFNKFLKQLICFNRFAYWDLIDVYRETASINFNKCAKASLDSSNTDLFLKLSFSNSLYAVRKTNKPNKLGVFYPPTFLPKKRWTIKRIKKTFSYFPFSGHSFYDVRVRKLTLLKKTNLIFRKEETVVAESSDSSECDTVEEDVNDSLLKDLGLVGPRAVIAESNLALISNSTARYNRFFDQHADNNFVNESQFLNDFVFNKKNIKKLIVTDRKDSRKIFVKSQTKFYYYYLRNDPVAGSYLFYKVINVFSKGYNRKVTRNAFYRLFLSASSEFSIDLLYLLIDSLKPEYINVKVRKGREFYEAPILASNVKAVQKAIKFFKKAVLSHTAEKTLFDKLKKEVENFFFWDGYKNEFFENYVAVSQKNMHLRHYRSANKY